MAFYKIDDDAVVMDDATFTGATSATVQVIVNQAISTGLPLIVRPGIYDMANVTINGPISVIGVPGKVTFRMTAAATGILYLTAFTRAEFTGIIFNGNNAAFTVDGALQPAQGLVNLRRDSTTLISQAIFRNCSFLNSTACGIGANDIRLVVDDCEFTSCALRSVGVITTDGASIRNSRFENQDHAICFSPGAAINTTVVDNVIRGCRRNGISFEPSGTAKVHRNITVRGNKISKRLASDTWAVRRTDLATTGAEGNGILIYLTENAVVENNEVLDCEFSAIRFNYASQATISGNVCRGSGETALYIEAAASTSVGEFGVTVTGNVVYGGGGGISVVNFNNDGRLSTVSGNLVRNIVAKTITSTSFNYAMNGAGIYVEADATISGNTIENAKFGIVLGTNDFTRDMTATGNVIRQTTVGIGAAAFANKDVLIASNLIAGYSSGAIKQVTYNGNDPMTIGATDISPANRAAAQSGSFHMVGNVKRATL